jgi:enamine deaminase RidA (YjgF/YER057c/UK114 family)
MEKPARLKRSDVPLVQTTRLLPLDSQGRLLGNAGKQTSQLLKNLEKVLAEAGSGLQHLVRINLYIAQEEDIEEIGKQMGRLLKGRAFPTVTRVITALPAVGAKVAADALAVAPAQQKLAGVSYFSVASSGSLPLAGLSILPAGRKVYVSGQAGRGQLLEATAKTMEELEGTLKFLGLGWEDVVQLKAFLHPMSRIEEVRGVMAGHIKNGKVPPLAFVEWISNLPIEIEWWRQEIGWQINGSPTSQ